MTQQIYCPGGSNSQTGSASQERYPDVEVADCGPIAEIESQISSHNGPFVIPIWNSHQGEVSMATFIWNSIRDDQIKVLDLWPKKIEFWYVRRDAEEESSGYVGSVVVAKSQCSGFFATREKELAPSKLTTIAFEEYKAGAKWDGVLVAPGQGEEIGYVVESKSTANPNNFTSFVKVIPSRCFSISSPTEGCYLTGVKMPAFGSSLGDTEQELFSNLLQNADSIEDIPRLIFVFDRSADVGLLLEGVELSGADLLDASQLEDGSVSVIPNAGFLSKNYCSENSDLCAEQFPQLVSADFILHRGVNTVLFACPALGLFTHGYDCDAVSPVFTFYVSQIFERWAEYGLACDDRQEAFFRKHEDAWRENGSQFVVFTEIGAT